MKSLEMASKLRRLRETAGFTLEEIADKLDISPQAISQYELAKRPIPTIFLLEMLTWYLSDRSEIVHVIVGVSDLKKDEKMKVLRIYTDLANKKHWRD